MTNKEIYEAYNNFVHQQLKEGLYDTIPHCDARILHHRSQCEYCNRPAWQQKRWELGIALTGFKPLNWQIPCEADVTRPQNSEGDHRRWGGNKPTISNGDESWPEETLVSKVMYGDPLTRPEVPINKG